MWFRRYGSIWPYDTMYDDRAFSCLLVSTTFFATSAPSLVISIKNLAVTGLSPSLRMHCAQCKQGNNQSANNVLQMRALAKLGIMTRRPKHIVSLIAIWLALVLLHLPLRCVAHVCAELVRAFQQRSFQSASEKPLVEHPLSQSQCDLSTQRGSKEIQQLR